MKNKDVGYLILGMTLIFFLIVVSFNNTLESIVNTSCDHGPTCPMHATLKTQKIISYSLIGFLVLISGLLLFFLKEEEKVVHHHTTIHQKQEEPHQLSDDEKKRKLEQLDEEEKNIMTVLFRESGSSYQSDLIKETNLTKVKVTRILDKLEGKSLIERKRRGMTNIIILK